MSGYAIELQGKVFTPDGRNDSLDVANHNAALEAQELAAWDAKPDRWQVYVEGNTVTTWTGKVLGTIIERSKCRHNISRNMVAIRFRGTNGATYYGRYGADWSQLCRVRKCQQGQF